MPDNIVEFINVTGRTYDQLISGVTIASTTASQQAVVKDVVLTNPNSRNLRLTVDGAVVAEANVATRLTGSELLAPSESLVLRTGQLALLNRIQAFIPSDTIRDNVLATQFGEVSASVATTNSNSQVTAFTGNPYFTVIAANGDFYYSDNNTGSLYRRAGGVNGSQSTITSNGRACSFDGRYIYSFGQGNQSMSVTDTQNNGSVSTGNFTGVTDNVTSNANSAAIDGYVWLKPDATVNNAVLINRATRSAIYLGGVADGSSQRFFVGIGKNSDGDYIGIHTTSYLSNSIYWWNFGPSLATPFIKASGGFTVSGAGNIANTNSNNIHRTPGADRFLLHIPGGGQNNTVIDLDTIRNNTATYFSLPGANIDQTSGRVLSLVASNTNSDFGAVNVRATGILTT